MDSLEDSQIDRDDGAADEGSGGFVFGENFEVISVCLGGFFELTEVPIEGGDLSVRKLDTDGVADFNCGFDCLFAVVIGLLPVAGLEIGE